MPKKILMLMLSSCGFGLGITGLAQASEYYSPMQPGISTGVPAGALPPPGLYADLGTNFDSGTVNNGSGHATSIKLSQASFTGELLYSPGWKLLNASYGMRLALPFSLNNVEHGPPDGQTNYTGYGFFNPIITPEILSWNLGGGNFISEGLTFYLPIGDFKHEYNPEAERQVESVNSFANHYWTFEPNLAYTYLADGWNITLNNTFDFNSTNHITHYHTGDLYYLDYTIAHDFGPFSLGVIGNYTQQFTDDEVNGVALPANPANGDSAGSRFMHTAIGPLISYNLGKVSFTLRYLEGLAGRNGGNASFLHFDVSFPIS